MSKIDKKKAKIIERINMLESELRNSLTKKDSNTREISVSSHTRQISELKSQLAKIGLVPDMKPVLYIRRRDMGGKNLGLEDIQKDYYVLCCYGGLEYNHHTISGTGDRTSGLYNKLNILNYQKIYGDIKYSLHFYKLISQKVYVKPVK